MGLTPPGAPPTAAADTDGEARCRALARALRGRIPPMELAVTRQLADRRERGTALVDHSLLATLPRAERDAFVAESLETSPECDRAIGALVGLAVGDSVGAPLEFLPAVDAPRASGHFWSHEAFAWTGPNTAEAERGRLALGQWTDDTAMALCLADSLLLRDGWDGSDARVRFWCWHAEGLNNCFRLDPARAARTSFGLGFNTARGLLALRPGERPAPRVQGGEDDAGNGSLMRLAPVPIFFFRVPDDVLEQTARATSFATHGSALAAEACATLASVQRGLMAGAARARGASVAEALEEEIARCLVRLEQKEPSAPDEALAQRELVALLRGELDPGGSRACQRWRDAVLPLEATLRARGERYQDHPVRADYLGSYCLDGLAMALHAVFHTRTFGAAVERAVNLLGDADTVGAIAGQLAGAFYGFRSIDPRYVEALARWDDGEIAARAALLFWLGPGGAAG